MSESAPPESVPPVELAAEPPGDNLAAEIRREYEGARAEQKRLKTFTKLASMSLVVIIVGFIWAIGAMAGEQWAPDKFQEPLQEAMQNLTPEAERHARQLVESVVPVYGEMARTKLDESLPQLRQSVEVEWRVLGRNLASTTEPEVTEALQRLQTRQWERMAKNFPILDSPEGRKAFADAWSAQVISDQADLLKEIDVRFAPHVEALHERMNKFLPNRFEDWHQDDVARYFVHLWLQLLDRKILGLIEVDQASGDATRGEEVNDVR